MFQNILLYLQPDFSEMDGMCQHIVVPVRGLPLGESAFRFEIGSEFFQAFENSQIKDADCGVKVSVIRHQTLLDIVCEIGGFLVVECDRCLEDLTLKVDIEPHLTVGFGSVDVDVEEDDVLVIDRSESELSLDQFVYDYICLSLPLVKVHPDGKCNPEMLRFISEGEGIDRYEENELSRPFEGLKDLLDNKNN